MKEMVSRAFLRRHAVHANCPARRRRQPGNQFEDRGLSAAGRADDADEFPLGNNQVDRLQDHPAVAVALGDAGNFDLRDAERLRSFRRLRNGQIQRGGMLSVVKDESAWSAANPRKSRGRKARRSRDCGRKAEMRCWQFPDGCGRPRRNGRKSARDRIPSGEFCPACIPTRRKANSTARFRCR